MVRTYILKPFLHYIYRPLVLQYLKKTRSYHFNGLKLIIPPGVFHPGLFFSTALMAEHLETFQLEGLHVLELGAGSGLLSLLAAKKGARVTATDINPTAVAAIQENARQNQATIDVLQGHLCKPLAGRSFDLILINPPYYPEKPGNPEEMAWYCGEEFEYFHALFEQLGAIVRSQYRILMVLSEDCQLAQIIRIARLHQFDLALAEEKSYWGEKQQIWEVIYNSNNHLPVD